MSIFSSDIKALCSLAVAPSESPSRLHHFALIAPRDRTGLLINIHRYFFIPLQPGKCTTLTFQHLDGHRVQAVALADSVDRSLDDFPEGAVT